MRSKTTLEDVVFTALHIRINNIDSNLNSVFIDWVISNPSTMPLQTQSQHCGWPEFEAAHQLY
jgi:hypothetical protein